MIKKFKRSLFIFRRDFRLEDNTGLIFALKASETVIPAFIFTPDQIENNPYRSDHCLKFMIESLIDLKNQLEEKKGNLFFFQGNPEEVFLKCVNKLKIEALFLNRDYTPYSQKRDKKLEKICQTHQIPFYSYNDALLLAPEETLKKDNTPYLIFTPYFRNASKKQVLAPLKNLENNYFQESISFADNSFISRILPNIKTQLIGGRTQAIKILKNLSTLTNYEQFKDFPAEDYSTHLSPYLKFTLCSPREIYAEICSNLGPQHPIIRSLYWRDFFTTIAYYFPHVFSGSFHSKFDLLSWSNDKNVFQLWCKGATGVPIVDAGMREMNCTGFMHNRVRMITASFLIKNLHINWRWGEKYFAQTLIDYDPSVNNGNWQWIASTGCDAQPYFRIFNPWNQQKKFDPNCDYIKKWVPELIDLSPKNIHDWYKKKGQEKHSKYPFPLVNHEKTSKESLYFYKSILKNSP